MRRSNRLPMALVLLLALATATTPLLAQTDLPAPPDTASAVDQPLALAPAVDRDGDLLPAAKRETLASLSVPEVAPRLAHLVVPRYPELARRARVSGVVYARILVGADGRVARVGEVRGHALFHEAVRQASRSWRFTPALQGDLAVSTWVTVPLYFEM